MTYYEFPKSFIWGAATAACQIEGAAQEGGKGESIWDRFSRIPGNVANGDTPEEACDHYHRFREDVELMRELRLGAYRFSIAWPRIYPNGAGKPNRKGLDFYNELVDALLDAGITPMATLYHWDLPQALQDKGGWENRDTASRFADYSACVFEALGDRVGLWITHNEPFVTSFAGHYAGEHAPGKRSLQSALAAAHHLLLSHGQAVRAFREVGRSGSRIGITLNMAPVYPSTSSAEDARAAALWDGALNRWFADPVFRGSYPDDMLQLYSDAASMPAIHKGDMEIIGSPVDFLGVNYYNPSIVMSDRAAQPFGFAGVRRGDLPVTDMGWEVYPEGLYDLMMRIKNDYAPASIYITENGAAYPDTLTPQGTVDDDERLDYIRRHLVQLHRAIQDGVPVDGYFVWSLLDNYEWAHGYAKRFGITYVDYHTQKRIPKKSALWYRDMIASNALRG
ncbi:MAG: GH1 family beta-glucosidase [Clostridia bacterium]|nr:GH1 family beta-glucosidase [Clostridia bacterium]